MISYVLYKDKCLMVIICYNFTKKNIIIWRRNCKRENVSKLYFHFFKKKCSKSLFKEIMHLLLLYGKERQHLRSLKLRKCNQKRKWRFFKKKFVLFLSVILFFTTPSIGLRIQSVMMTQLQVFFFIFFCTQSYSTYDNIQRNRGVQNESVISSL